MTLHDTIPVQTLLSSTVPSATALIAAILAAYLTSRLTARRDHEAEWRKLKLDRYQEFIAAMSDADTGTAESKTRFKDALNALAFVASISVLKEVYSYQDQLNNLRRQNPGGDLSNEMSALIRKIRGDVGHEIGSESNTKFRLFRDPE